MRKLLLTVLTIVFIASSGMTVYRLVDSYRADIISKQALELSEINSVHSDTSTYIADEPVPLGESPFGSRFSDTLFPLPHTQAELNEPEQAQAPLPEEAQLLTEINLEALVEVNADVIGWIYIPNGDISHPLVHSHDNSEYLSHAWNGEKSSSGAIFMEQRSSKDFSDFNTLIYGHNMRNNKFFAPLHKYADKEHLENCRYVYILTENKILQYQVFSAYKASIKSNTYRLVFKTDEIKQKSINHYIESSVWDAQIQLTTQDKILTLSTCTRLGEDDYRWVVQARLCEEWQNKKESA